MSIAERVSTNPVILRNIFLCIPVRALNSCARVCQKWAHMIASIKRTQRGIAWYYHRCNESEGSLNLLAQEIEAFRDKLYFEPDFALVFCSSSLYLETVDLEIHDGEGRLRAPKKDKVEICTFLERSLPSRCRVTTITADGIVGTSSDGKTTEEIEGFKCLSFVVFSKFSDNSDIIPLYYTTKDGNRLTSYWKDDARRLRIEQVPDDKLVRTIMFLCNDPDCPQEVGFSLFKMYNSPLIAGGFVDMVVSPNHWELNPYLCCLAFCGEKMNVASVVIKDDTDDIEEVEKTICKLKAFKVPEINSVGFMFACVGRGMGHYGDYNIESKVFKKYFPNTPLLGFFGNGEVGFQYPLTKPADVKTSAVHNESDDEQIHQFVKFPSQYLATHPPKMFHAYTTIMCIMSFSL